MKVLFKKILLIVFVLFLVNGINAQENSSTIRIDSFLNYLKTNNAFYGNVVLRKGDSIIYRGDYNTLSSGSGLFRVGSVSKVFTAIVIFQLIEEGRLSLATKLNEFFPEIRNSSTINIGNLLSHTSGIYDITAWDEYYGQRDRPFTREEVISVITKHKPAFKPNEDCSYSNSNFVLLGYIIEKITKDSYAQNLRERIAIPLNLKNTYVEISGSENSKRESSFKFDGETWFKDKDSDPTFPGAAGAVISNPEDLTTMIVSLFEKQLVSDSSLVRMKTLRNKSTGHGIFRAPFFDKEGWGHSGRIDEFRSFVGYFPDDSLSIAITSNAGRINLNVILIGILSSYYQRDFKYPEFITTDIEVPPTSHFTGKYKAKLFRLITVARFQIVPAGHNFLFMKEGFSDIEGDKALIERRGAYDFYAPDAKGELTFFENKKGKIKGLKLKQGKLTIRCKKVPGKV